MRQLKSTMIITTGYPLTVLALGGCSSETQDSTDSAYTPAPANAGVDTTITDGPGLAEQHFLTVAEQLSQVLSRLPASALLQLGHAACTDLEAGPMAGAVATQRATSTLELHLT